jgi:hypothetical protein
MDEPGDMQRPFRDPDSEQAAIVLGTRSKF